MSVTLQKGGNVSLAKASPGLRSVLIGLGWDARTTRGVEFDLDASAFLLDANDRVLADEYFIFYNNLVSPDGSVEHTGDNRTGEGEGDDESIRVELYEVPAAVQRIVVVVSIHEAIERGQNFGQVRNAFIRVVDAASEAEVARYDLSEDASVETTMIFGELYRRDGDWKFRAVGQGYSSGLAGIARDFGVNLA
ncbi:TerD family protein [Jatrophihabitans sp. YIM 134969]